MHDYIKDSKDDGSLFFGRPAYLYKAHMIGLENLDNDQEVLQEINEVIFGSPASRVISSVANVTMVPIVALAAAVVLGMLLLINRRRA